MPGINTDKVVHQDITNNMRRANKATAAVKRSHLDVQSGADMNISSKIHKKKSNTNNSSLALALLCGAAALCTLLYVSNKVFSSTTAKSERKVFSEHMEEIKKERYLPQENRLLPPDSIYRTKIEDIHGNYQQLMDYAGSVSLVVNVACE
jgi:hypothetical protein